MGSQRIDVRCPQLYGLAADAGLIYAVEGNNSTGTLNTAEVYHPTTHSWSAIASMSTARWILAAAKGGDGRVYAIGGTGNGGALSSVEAYRPSTNSWSSVASLPRPTFGMAAATGPNGRIYVLGGYDTSVGGGTSSVEIYDPISNSWAQGPYMSTPRYGPAATTGLDGRIYVLGGNTSGIHSSGLNTAEVYTPKTNSWSSLPPMSTARSYLAAATGPDGRIYAIGGDDNSYVANILASVEAYDPIQNVWQPVAAMPGRRSTAGASVGPFGGINVVGGSDGANALSSVVSYAAPPSIRSVSPTSGPAAGGTIVKIRGSDFNAVTAVHFGTVAAKSFTVNSPTLITAISPKESAGIVNVTVRASGVTTAVTPVDQFRFT
jgi:IPT/TIG domain/Kelch motif